MVDDTLVTRESLKTILPVYESNILRQVKNDAPRTMEPADDDIPMIFLTGVIPDSKDYVSGELEYISKSEKFHAYTLIRLQGNSSLAYAKKNCAFSLFSDAQRSVKLNKEFRHWGAHNNFVLKADYIDILKARNVVAAKLWDKVVKSRSDYASLPAELRDSPNSGAIDGFPVKVYINGSYVGLYNWTIPKGAWQFGLDESNTNHILLNAKVNDNGNVALQYNPCNFNAQWSLTDNSWDVEVGALTQSTVDSFNAIVLAQSQEAFENALDVQSAIDYYIFQEIILGTDGLAKNMLLVTYDGVKWHLSPYDMDATFGLDYHGDYIWYTEANIPDYPFLNNYSALRQMVWSDTYWGTHKNRYWELRNSALSATSIISEFDNYVQDYDLCVQDAAWYPDIPVLYNSVNNLKYWIFERLNYLDGLYTSYESEGET